MNFTCNKINDLIIVYIFIQIKATSMRETHLLALFGAGETIQARCRSELEKYNDNAVSYR